MRSGNGLITVTFATPASVNHLANQTATSGSPVTFTASAAGYPTPTFHSWYVSTDGGTTFTIIPGVNSPSYTFTPAVADNGNLYRALFLNGSATLYTNAATLTVTSASLSVSPASGSSSTQGAFAGQLSTSGGSGGVTYAQSSGSPAVVVSSSGAVTSPAPLAAGTYTASGSVTDSLGSTGTWSFTLTRTATVLSSTPATASRVYGSGFEGQLTTTGGSGTVTYVQSSGSPNVVVSATGAVSAPASLGVGSYTASGTSSDTYGDSGSWSFTLTVTKAVLSVNAVGKSKVFGDGDPGLTATLSGFVGTDTAASSGITGLASCGRVAGESVAGSPYTITCGPGTLAAPNYTFATGSTANLVITRAAPSGPSVSNIPAVPTYGGGFAATVATSGDGTKSVTTSTPSVCAVSGLNVSFVAAGTCSLTAHVAAGANYNEADGVAQSFTVAKAVLSVDAVGKSKTYGDGDPALTATLSGFKFTDTATSSGITGSASCDRSTGEPVAGSPYAITCGAGTLAAPNYTFVTGSTANLTIGRAVLSVNAVGKSKVFGDGDPGLTATLSEFVGTDTAASSGITGLASCGRVAGESVAGSPYTITCGPGTLAAPNYTFATGSTANLVITRAAPSGPSVSNIPAVPTYGGGFAATVATSGDGTKSVTTSTPSVCAVSGLNVSFVAAGTCSLTAHVAAGANYNEADGVAQSFTVAKAVLSVDAVGKSKTYGDGDPALTATLSGFKFTDTATSSGITGSASCDRSTGEPVAGSPYAITCGAGTLAAPNYTFVTGSTANLTISPAAPSAPVVSNIPAVPTYGGAFAATVATTGDGTKSVTTSTPSVCAVSGLNVTFVAAGTCILRAHVAAGSNYLGADGTAQSFTAAQAVLNVNADPKSKTYGAADPGLTATLSGFQFADTATSSGITGTASCGRVAGESVGGSPYAITCAPGTLAAPNYSFATGTSADLTIDPAVLSVDAVAKSKTYGAADPGLTATLSGFQFADTATSSGITGSASCGRVAGESVGGSPYAITCAPGTLAAPNYSFATGTSADLTIDPAVLSVDAVAKSKTYGAADPGLTATLSGFQFADTATSSGITGTASCGRVAGESVGGSPYAITCAPGTLAAPNYSFATGTSADLTIDPAAPSAPVVSNIPAAPTYGGGFAATVATTGDGIKSVTSSTPSVCAVSGLNVSFVAAGTCSLTAHVAAGANYGAADDPAQSFTVAKAVLNVNADPKSKTYGNADPALTATLSGFKGTDTATNSGITNAASCSRVAGESVAGSPYTITCAPGTLTAPNYTFATGTTANLTVTPKPVTVTGPTASKVYGQPNPSLAPSYGGLVAGDDPNTAATCTTTATATSGVAGSPYVVTCGGAVDPNYSFSYTNGSLTITKAASTTLLSAAPSPSQYGQGVTLTATVAPTPAGSGVATGSVLFMDGANTLGTTSVTGGTATLTVATLSTGGHTLRAMYLGDTNVAAGSSTGRAHTVNKATTTLVAAKADRGFLRVTFSATLSRVHDGASLAGRTVTFRIGSANVCTATTNNTGVATCTKSAVIIGSAGYTAAFAGDTNHLASTGTARL